MIRFHPEAAAEYAEAVSFYSDRAVGLGREFFDEVQRVVSLIEENPRLGSPLKGPFRRVFCRRFPFAIVYVVDDSVIRVRAVMHLRRKPGYWQGRG